MREDLFMKKLVLLSLCLLFALTFTACGEKMDKTSSSLSTSKNDMGSSLMSDIESGFSSTGSAVESAVSSVISGTGSAISTSSKK